jgi:hypothetical protein
VCVSVNIKLHFSTFIFDVCGWAREQEEFNLDSLTCCDRSILAISPHSGGVAASQQQSERERCTDYLFRVSQCLVIFSDRKTLLYMGVLCTLKCCRSHRVHFLSSFINFLMSLSNNIFALLFARKKVLIIGYCLSWWSKKITSGVRLGVFQINDRNQVSSHYHTTTLILRRSLKLSKAIGMYVERNVYSYFRCFCGEMY